MTEQSAIRVKVERRGERSVRVTVWRDRHIVDTQVVTQEGAVWKAYINGQRLPFPNLQAVQNALAQFYS